jgi:hypothetical protein
VSAISAVRRGSVSAEHLEEHESDYEGMGEQQHRAERKRKLPISEAFK